MNSFKHYSNTELNQRLLSLVQRERELLAEIILHIQEINRRKIFLELAYPSMFAYMTEHLKYSPGSAMRRLDAAKIASQAPEVLQQLQEGSLNLSQVSMVEQTVRQIQKLTPQRSVSIEQKRELLNNLSGKTKAQSEVLVAQALGLKPMNEQKIETHQADESVNMTLTFSKDEWDQIQQMRELLSNATGGGIKETFLHVARKVIQQKTTMRKSLESAGKRSVGSKQLPIILKANLTPVRTPVSATVRRAMFQKHQSCQFKYPNNGKVCGSKNFLSIEHLKPVWAGGDNRLANLTVLCSAHNLFKYQQQAGVV